MFIIFVLDCCLLRFPFVFGFECCRFSRLSFLMPESVAKVLMPPPFPVAEYVVDNPNSLDARHFAEMRDDSAVEELPDQNGTRRLTAAGGWGKRWNHRGGRGGLTTAVPYENLNMPYIK